MNEGKRNAIAHHVSVLFFFYFLKVKITNYILILIGVLLQFNML